MTIETKLNQIIELAKEIRNEDEFTGVVLFEGLGLSMNILEAAAANRGRDKIDISEHLEIVSRVLGVSLKDLVSHAIQTMSSTQQKEPDEDTLKFITSDLDDYEKFLAQSKAKKSIEFLAKEI